MKKTFLLFTMFGVSMILSAQVADVLLASERDREQIIHHKSYSLSYNSSYVLPSWISYKITKSQVDEYSKVKEKYVPDPNITTRSANKNDYKEGGFGMCQLANYLDIQNIPGGKEEAFYMSNIVAMKPAFYNFIWAKTEELIRLWNAGTDGLYITCGPVLADAPFAHTLGANNVGVPKRLYKVIYDPKNQKALGFIFTNGNASGKLKSYAMSVDDVEKIIGIDLFKTLDDEIENTVEKEFNINDWNFELIEK